MAFPAPTAIYYRFMLMRYLRNYFTFLCLAFLAGVTLFVSCSDDEANNVYAGETQISTTEMTFPAAGDTLTLSVLSGTEPQVTSNQDWCTVAFVNVTQRGTYTYRVVAAENTTTDNREAVLDVVAGSFTAQVQVTQQAGNGLIVEQTAYEMPAAGGPLAITLTTNGDYAYTINDGWIAEAEVSDTRAMTAYTLHFTVSANHGAERTGSITFTLGTLTETVTVTQAAGQAATISGNTPYEIAASMGLGWNLGNQLDANNNGVADETAWGNQPATQALFDAVAAAGFTSVRIPVTWLGHMGEAPDYTIESAYMDRVAEVVGYAESAGLNAIINIHHDGSDSQYWLNIKEAAASEERNEEIKAQLSAVWTQIANRFRDKGNFLMFEAMNEIHDGGWGWGDNRTDGGRQYAVLNEWNQVFVDAVRATGGNNASRYLGVPGYVTNIDLTVENFVLPEDVADNRLLVAVHFYDPNEFTLEATASEWGHTGDSSKKATWGDEDNVTTQFGKMKSTFIDKGIPAYIGEMGCVHRADSRSESFRMYYLEYVCKAARDYGMPLFYWDNGSANAGKECSGFFNHATGELLNNAQEVIDVMKRGWFTEDESYTLQSVYDSAPQ